MIVNHLFRQPSGGFVGVDIFFVVSGFLITGLLLREQDRKGRLSLADFYRRRARRILPAAVLVILTTVVATYLAYNTSRGAAVRADAIWALLFVSNWHFAISGTDYWQLGATSPLQHFWSLGVEEQFYIFWPWLLTLLLVGSVRRGRLLAPAMLGVVGASFAYSLWHTQAQPTWAYFSTLDRAWELALGAVLASSASRLAHLPAAIRMVVGWIGLLGIVGSFFVIDPNTVFPAPWAVLPAVSTAVVIIAGIGGDQPWLFPLVNPIARYVGDISYSLYLWHFPIIILAKAFYPRGGTEYWIWCLGLTAALSVACFHFLEEPVRVSNWLEPRAKRRRTRPREGAGGPRYAVVGIVAILAIMFSALSFAHVRDANLSASEVAAAQKEFKAQKSSARRKLTPLESKIRAAVNSSKFPDLKPGVDELNIDKWRTQIQRLAGCGSATPANYIGCTVGPADAQHTAVVLGDSYAQAYLPGIVKGLTPRGWRVQNLSMEQCPTWDVAVNDGADRHVNTGCARHRAWVNGLVAQQEPDLAILISTYPGNFGRLSSGATGDAAAAEARAGLTREIRILNKSVGRLVVLEPPQPTPPLQQCVTNVGSPDDCEATVSAVSRLGESAESEAAKATGAKYVNTVRWFCDIDDVCPGFVGTIPVRVDGDHLTIEYCQSLAPLLAKVLL